VPIDPRLTVNAYEPVLSDNSNRAVGAYAVEAKNSIIEVNCRLAVIRGESIPDRCNKPAD
jgi:hypothetical protein